MFIAQTIVFSLPCFPIFKKLFKMKKYCIALALFVITALNVSASITYESMGQWKLFCGNYSFFDNKAYPKMNFDGAQEAVGSVELSNGNVAFAVQGKGIFIFDGKTLQVAKMPADCYAVKAEITTMAADSKDVIWMGTSVGLVKFEANTYTNIPMEATKLMVITDIAITATDKVYVSGMVPGDKEMAGGGVSFYNGVGWNNYTKATSDIPDNLMSNLMLDNNGHLWAIPGKHDVGVAKFDGKNWKQFTNGNGLPTNVINALATNASGKVWLGSPKGVIEFDGSAFSMKPFSNGFSNNFSDFVSKQNNASIDVSALAVEGNGTIWVGTRNSGILSFATGGFKQLTPQNSPLFSGQILSIRIDKNGYKWFTAGYQNEGFAKSFVNDRSDRNPSRYKYSESGAVAYKEHKKITDPKWQVYDSTTTPFYYGQAYGIAEDKEGAIWMGTSIGLVKLKDGAFSVFKAEKAMHSAFSNIYLAPDGKLFASSTLGGIKVFEGSAIKDYAKSPGMGGATDMVYDKNNVLWATSQWGVGKFVNGEWETFKKSDGLPGNILFCILKDKKGDLWAGTSKGLAKYDTAWHEVGAENDFPSNNFNAIAEDSKGRIWLGTNKGISIFDGTKYTNIAEIESLKLSKFRVNSIFIDKNDVAWLGTEAYGVLRFDGTIWSQYSKETTGGMYNRIVGLRMSTDGKLYVASETTSFQEFSPAIPTQNQEENLWHEVMGKVKLCEQKKVLTIIKER